MADGIHAATQAPHPHRLPLQMQIFLASVLGTGKVFPSWAFPVLTEIYPPAEMNSVEGLNDLQLSPLLLEKRLHAERFNHNGITIFKTSHEAGKW